MTGPFESIIGRRIDRVLETTLTGLPDGVRRGDRGRAALWHDRRGRLRDRPGDRHPAAVRHRSRLAATPTSSDALGTLSVLDVIGECPRPVPSRDLVGHTELSLKVL